MLAAPGERRVIGRGEVERHHRKKRVQKPLGLAERQVEDEPERQGRFDGQVSTTR